MSSTDDKEYRAWLKDGIRAYLFQPSKSTYNDLIRISKPRIMDDLRGVKFSKPQSETVSNLTALAIDFLDQLDNMRDVETTATSIIGSSKNKLMFVGDHGVGKGYLGDLLCRRVGADAVCRFVRPQLCTWDFCALTSRCFDPHNRDASLFLGSLKRRPSEPKCNTPSLSLAVWSLIVSLVNAQCYAFQCERAGIALEPVVSNWGALFRLPAIQAYQHYRHQHTDLIDVVATFMRQYSPGSLYRVLSAITRVPENGNFILLDGCRDADELKHLRAEYGVFAVYLKSDTVDRDPVLTIKPEDCDLVVNVPSVTEFEISSIVDDVIGLVEENFKTVD